MKFLDCKETQRPVILEAITLLARAGKLHDIGVRAGIKPVLQELDDACLDSPAAPTVLGRVLAVLISLKLLDFPFIIA
eukprot:13547-Heterococcus_DN1.PRE.2